MSAPTVTPGSEWLFNAPDDAGACTPEQLTDEHRLIATTTREFVREEVLPARARLEAKDWSVARSLVRRCGELGMLGATAPERYGGLELDTVTSLVIAQNIAPLASFAATFGGQTNLSIAPLCLFGSEEQKQKYLPGLISGECVGAYALSEAEAGSDPLGARTRATRTPEGAFVLNGEKMWITNAGLADLFVVFAKVDGEAFTAFLVERAFTGVSTGKEEHKMGLDGSSTATVVLEDVRVPSANVLGEVGKGHKVAFNVLNVGRFKLSATCCGAAIAAIGDASRYAADRQQFGRPIAAFGAIKHKLGEMIVRTYAVESLSYRIAGLIDTYLAAHGGRGDHGEDMRAAFEAHAVEASIAKVAGSEMLGYVADENVQIHGGNGFVRDYAAERHYRDARVNRIFEGTNEINRILLAKRLVRVALERWPSQWALRAGSTVVRMPLAAARPPRDATTALRRSVDEVRHLTASLLHLAGRTYEAAIDDEQEVLLHLADIAIDLFSADSAVLRSAAAVAAQVPDADLHLAAATAFVDGAVLRIAASVQEALGIMCTGNDLTAAVTSARDLVPVMPTNTAALRRRLADAAVARGEYVFA